MATITIEIDVVNPQEVIKEKKGTFTSLMAGLFMSDEKLKNEVETKVCEEIIGQLRSKINDGLSSQGVLARVRYTMEVGQEMKSIA